MGIGTRKNIIDVLIRYATEGAERANAVARKTNKAITTQQDKYADANKETKRGIVADRNKMIANANAGQVMRMNAEVLGNYNKQGRKFNSASARMANRFRMMTHGARGFRMEMLGVMFFGMALQRTFTGLLKTSMQWMGVMEVFSQTLGILFLPIAEVLLEWALKFLDWVLQLSDEQKKTIGWFVLVGAAVGTLIFLIGTLALGIGSMILAFNFSKIATIIGSSGLGGMGTAATNAAKKVGGLKTKLGKLARYAGAAILFSIALEDGAEGKFVAALGDVMMGAGLIAGKVAGTWLMAAGFTLKFVGDAEFQVSVYKVFWRLVDFAAWVGETIAKLLTGQIGKVDWTPLETMGDSSNKALGELAEKGQLISDTMNEAGLDVAMQNVVTETKELNDVLVETADGLVFKEGIENLSILEGRLEAIRKKQEEVNGSTQNYLDMLSTRTKSPFNIGKTFSLGNLLTNLFNVNDAIISPNGNVITTHPDDYLIATKTPGALGGGSGEVTMNVTYYVTVSDKSEFKMMLEENNRQLTDNVRRIGNW